MAVENHEPRPAPGLPKDPEGVLDTLQIVGVVDPQDIPAITQKPRRDVLGEGDLGAAFDGDVVVVIDPAEVVEPKVTGERGGLRADALHQAALAAHRVDGVIEHLETGLVVAGGEPTPGDGHADARGDALSERPVVVSTPETRWYSG
jgi:hypothetical protein